jgi:hypothetical protein
MNSIVSLSDVLMIAVEFDSLRFLRASFLMTVMGISVPTGYSTKWWNEQMQFELFRKIQKRLTSAASVLRRV